MSPRPSPDLAASTVTKGERTRRRLLALAIEHFGASGYRSTSVSEIARAAGVTQATAYAYFDNKESLFIAAVDSDASELVLSAHATLTDAPAVNRFQEFLAALYLALNRHQLTRRVLAGEEPGVLSRISDLPALRLVTSLIVEDLRAGQRDGTVRADVDIVVLGDGVEAIVMSLLVAAVQSDGISVPRYVAGLAAAFDAMLQPPPLG